MRFFKEVEGGLEWLDRPVEDATKPELNNNGKKAVFYTQSSMDKVYEGCARIGLKVLGFDGGLAYSRLTIEKHKDEFGVTHYHNNVSKQIEGMYKVTVSIPKE